MFNLFDILVNVCNKNLSFVIDYDVKYYDFQLTILNFYAIFECVIKSYQRYYLYHKTISLMLT